jgi:ribose-phosphate pyrophosphokinase
MLVIDSDNYAAAGIEAFFFPGGEPHVKLPDFSKEALVLHLKLRTWRDVGLAAVLCDALTNQRGYLPPTFMPYLPGARQDRTDGLTPITARVIGDLFKGHVTTFDVHSRAAQTHFGNVGNMMPTSDLFIGPNALPDDIAGIIVPDDGAFERATGFARCVVPTGYIQAKKKRDFKTGRILSYSLEPLPCPGTYIIVDDICDGGATFNLLVDEFLKDPFAGLSRLVMFVSHGIFSKGVDAIHPKIQKIYTTDSFCKTRETLGRLHIIPLLPHYLRFEGIV